MAWLDNLLFWLTHDEESGQRNDAHSTGQHFTDNNTVGFAPGVNGNASLLVRSNNEYLSRPGGIAGFDPSQPWTCITRFYINVEHRNGGIFSINDATNTFQGLAISIHPERTGEVGVRISGADGLTIANWRSGTVDINTLQQWHTLRTECDGVITAGSDGKNQVRIYLDAIPVVENGVALGTSGNVSTPTTGGVPAIGGTAYVGYGPSHIRYFEGMFDDSALFNRLLTSQEIADYEAGATYADIAGGGPSGDTVNLAKGEAEAAGFALTLTPGQIRTLSRGIAHATGSPVNAVQGTLLALAKGAALARGYPLSVQPGASLPIGAGRSFMLEFEDPSLVTDSFGNTQFEVVGFVSQTGGMNGSALDVPGATASYLRAATSPYVENGGKDWTYAFFIHADDLSNQPYILCKAWNNNTFELAVRLRSDGTVLVQLGNELEQEYYQTAKSITAGAWHMIFLAFNEESGLLEIGFNDDESEFFTYSMETAPCPDYLYVGCKDPGNVTFRFNGKIDQLTKWDRRLSTADRLWLYNGGAGRTAQEITGAQSLNLSHGRARARGSALDVTQGGTLAFSKGEARASGMPLMFTLGGGAIGLSAGTARATGFNLAITEAQVRTLSRAIARATGRGVGITEGQIRTLSMGLSEAHGFSLAIKPMSEVVRAIGRPKISSIGAVGDPILHSV